MYQKLLLSNEGGIIDIAQQSEQDNCAVVCIGLGGTGVDCLKNLKAKIYNRVRPDNPDAAVPKYSHIKFLAVDTDKTGLVAANDKSSDITKIDLDTEFFDISYSGDIGTFFRTNSGVLEERSHYKEWLRHQDIDVLSAKAGAGGVRQLGRYLMMERAEAFVNKVRTLVTQALTGLIAPKTYIHIFSGLSGGTGAGTFLDVCYLVQHALNADKTNSFVLGYFFLPDVNLANNLDTETQKYVKVNGYASLQELDYCMNFKRNGDRWSQIYGGIGLIENDAPPVDICHLISAKDTNGNVISGAYRYAMNVVTDYFMDFVTKTGSTFTMDSHISNYTQKKDNIHKEFGAHYEYCVLGAATATLPFKEVLTYLASEMFGKFSNVKNIVPGNADIASFIAANGLKYDNIFAQLVQGADMRFPLPDNRWQDAKNNDDLTTTYFTDLRARAENAIEGNYSALVRDMDNYDPVEGNTSDVSRSIIAKIYAAIRLILTDPQKGPFFGAYLLRSTTNQDLLAILDGYIKEVNNKYSQENVQESRLRPEWEAAQSDFFSNAGFLNGKGKYEKYCNATRNLVIHYTKLTAFQKMRELLERLRKQVADLADNFTDVFKGVVKSLIETFEANKKFIDELAPTASDYEFPLATIDQLRDSLDLTIKEMDIAAKATDFLTMMLSKEGIKAWINNNENEIASVVNKYFTALFSSYSSKTMTSYLEDKYHTTNSEQLVTQIRNDIMNKLDNKANPMFWTSNIYSAANASHIGYITFPAVSDVVGIAAANLASSKNTGELNVRNSSIQDRISIMRCLVGVPLYGYQGLLQYENDSLGSQSVGKHLYEGKNYTNDNGEMSVGRDWRYLPSPVPLSQMNSTTNSIIRDNASKAKDLYEAAEAKGIINKTAENSYGVFRIADDFMDKIYAARDSANGKTKVEQLDAIDTIKKLMENVEYEHEKIAIPNDGAVSLSDRSKRMVRIDHFVSAVKLQGIVSAELAKYQEIEKILVELEPKDDSDLIAYQNALFTGIITFESTYVICTDEFGTEIELSTPTMPKGAVPIYQALLSFKELDQEVRDYIAAEAKSRLSVRVLSDDAKEASRAVWDELKNIKFMIQDAIQEFPEDVKELKELLPAIKDAVKSFARKYKFDLE